MNTRLLAISSLLIITACNNPQSNNESPRSAVPVKADINSVKWLIGKWQHTAEGKIYFEHWRQENDSTLSAVSGAIKGTDTAIQETVVLQQKGSELFYIPTVKDQNEGKSVSFRLTSATASDFIFENTTHDFPQMITYSKKSATSLLARISGKSNGKEHEEYFPMDKVE